MPNSQGSSSAPATSPSPAEDERKKRPQGDNASPEGNNSKKSNWPGWSSPSWLEGWMSNSLLRSRGAAPKGRTWFSGSS